MEVTSLCIFNLLSLLLSNNVFTNSGGICYSFINPTLYIEIGYFLPFYTENVANKYEMIFFLQTYISFICVVYSKEKKHVSCEDQISMLEI